MEYLDWMPAVHESTIPGVPDNGDRVNLEMYLEAILK